MSITGPLELVNDTSFKTIFTSPLASLLTIILASSLFPSTIYVPGDDIVTTSSFKDKPLPCISIF